MKPFTICLLLVLSYCNQLWANDSLAIQKLIKSIYSQQAYKDDYFPDGLFPSYREYYFNRGTLKKDDNSFFTGLVLFTLRQLRPLLDSSSQLVCDTIISKASPVFTKFQNRKGQYVYSFWQTNPVKYFPNSGWLSLFKSNALPDDADCSVIILMALDVPTLIAGNVHQYMQAYSNCKKRKVQSTYACYKSIPAYSTWLGHKVPIDFDICVLSNILSFVHSYDLPYTKADSASLELICQVVKKRQYKTDAVYLSPYYNTTPVILYHLARLMNGKHIPALEKYRTQLIDDARMNYAQADNIMEKVILSTALLKWDVILPEFEQDLPTSSMASEEFVFFVANMASMLPNPINRPLTRAKIGRFDYYCPVYNDVLVLENLVLRTYKQ